MSRVSPQAPVPLLFLTCRELIFVSSHSSFRACKKRNVTSGKERENSRRDWSHIHVSCSLTDDDDTSWFTWEKSRRPYLVFWTWWNEDGASFALRQDSSRVHNIGLMGIKIMIICWVWDIVEWCTSARPWTEMLVKRVRRVMLLETWKECYPTQTLLCIIPVLSVVERKKGSRVVWRGWHSPRPCPPERTSSTHLPIYPANDHWGLTLETFVGGGANGNYSRNEFVVSVISRQLIIKERGTNRQGAKKEVHHNTSNKITFSIPFYHFQQLSFAAHFQELVEGSVLSEEHHHPSLNSQNVFGHQGWRARIELHAACQR